METIHTEQSSRQELCSWEIEKDVHDWYPSQRNKQAEKEIFKHRDKNTYDVEDFGQSFKQI